MPVSCLNFATSLRSRLWLDPTAASPTNVIFWPLYFALSAAALGTAGGAIAADLTGAACAAGRDVPAAAALSDATSVTAPISPATTSSARCFTVSFLSLRPGLGVDPFSTCRDYSLFAEPNK